MESAQIGRAAWAAPASILHCDWVERIRMAPDLDDLLHVMRRYLEQWTPEDLRELPLDIAATALPSSEDLLARAVIASRAELQFVGKNERQHFLLREISLAYSSAAIRRCQLVALRGR